MWLRHQGLSDPEKLCCIEAISINGVHLAHHQEAMYTSLRRLTAYMSHLMCRGEQPSNNRSDCGDRPRDPAAGEWRTRLGAGWAWDCDAAHRPRTECRFPPRNRLALQRWRP